MQYRQSRSKNRTMQRRKSYCPSPKHRLANPLLRGSVLSVTKPKGYSIVRKEFQVIRIFRGTKASERWCDASLDLCPCADKRRCYVIWRRFRLCSPCFCLCTALRQQGHRGPQWTFPYPDIWHIPQKGSKDMPNDGRQKKPCL